MYPLCSVSLILVESTPALISLTPSVFLTSAVGAMHGSLMRMATTSQIGAGKGQLVMMGLQLCFALRILVRLTTVPISLMLPVRRVSVAAAMPGSLRMVIM